MYKSHLKATSPYWAVETAAQGVPGATKKRSTHHCDLDARSNYSYNNYYFSLMTAKMAPLELHNEFLVPLGPAMESFLTIGPRNHRITQAVGSHDFDAAFIVQIVQNHHLDPNPLASLDSS